MKRRTRRQTFGSRRARLESLEHRRVMATFNLVGGVADGQSGSLRDAIMQANSNGEDDIINLAAGDYELTQSGGVEALSNTQLSTDSSNDIPTDLEAFNDLDLTEAGHSITILGAGAGNTTIQGGNDRVFHIHPNVEFVLEDVTLSGSRTTYDGGALLNDGGDSILRHVTLTGNSADGERIDSLTQLIGGGGAIANYHNQEAFQAGTLLVEDSIISNNFATDRDGRGGGLYVRGGNVTLLRTEVDNNHAIGSPDTHMPSGGGGIANEHNLFLIDSAITNNVSEAGAGILNNGGNLDIDGTEIAHNEVDDSSSGGGAIYNVGPTFVVRNSYLHDNTVGSQGQGGAIWIQGGGANIYNTTIANNEVDGSIGQAGAIFNDGGGLVFVNSTISGNTAADTGGIYMNGGNLNMTFSTVFNNNAFRSTYAESGAFTNIGASQFKLDHTIVVGNRGNNNPSGWVGGIQSGGYLIYGDIAASQFDSNGSNFSQNINLDDPGTVGELELQPLDDTDYVPGGPVPTHALGENSLAIDHGSNSGGIGTIFSSPPETDARGVRRPQGAQVDVGAHEVEVPNSPPTADTGGPYSAAIDSNVTLDASGSTDPDAGDTLAYAWDLDNNGQYNDAFTAQPTFSLAGVGINTPGSHTIKLRVTDAAGEQDTDTTTLTVSSGAVEGRWAFYNNSYYDGNNTSASAADDGAIATNVEALLPGETSTTANISSFSRGINGIMVDIDRGTSGSTITANDFIFRMANQPYETNVANFVTAPAPANVTVRAGDGVGDTDRVTLVWTDATITNTWLEVTVKANANTGIGAPDKFYFGSAIGDSFDSLNSSAVNGTDFGATRVNTHNFLDRAPKDDAYDFNRDSLVNATDLALIRDNATTFSTQLQMISPPGGSSGEGEGEGGFAGLVPSSQPTSSGVSVKSTEVVAEETDVEYANEVNQDLLIYTMRVTEDGRIKCTAGSPEDLEAALDLIAEDLLEY